MARDQGRMSLLAEWCESKRQGMWRAAGWVVGEYVRFGEPVYEGGGGSCFEDLSQRWGGRRVGQREGCQESGDGRWRGGWRSGRGMGGWGVERVGVGYEGSRVASRMGGEG